MLRLRATSPIGVIIVCLAISLGGQIRSGAWESDFGAHGDEGAHVVTSLMVRDYVTGRYGRTMHPVRYAEDYYARFPKVAIGHYPPVFYLLNGAGLLPARGKATLLVLAAVFSTLLGFVTWMAGRRRLSPAGALVAAATVCALPLVRTYTAMVMSDVLLASLCLLAAVAMARFIEAPKARTAVGFGLLATTAILTKGSGLLLAFVPPIAVSLCGQLALLKSRRLWWAIVPVLLLALPWMLATYHITAEGMSRTPFGQYLVEAMKFYPRAFLGELGVSAALLAGLAAFAKPTPSTATLWSLLIATLLLYLLVPSGLDARYLLPAVPPTVLLAVQGAEAVGRRLWRSRHSPPIFAGALSLALLIETARPVIKRYTGAAAAIAAIAAITAPGRESTPVRILISSDSRGEGALVAAAALSESAGLSVIRGSKALASMDWLGRGYRARFHDPDELLAFLQQRKIDDIVIDAGIPPHLVQAHHRLLEATVTAHPDIFEPSATIPSMRGRRAAAEFRLYHRR